MEEFSFTNKWGLKRDRYFLFGLLIWIPMMLSFLVHVLKYNMAESVYGCLAVLSMSVISLGSQSIKCRRMTSRRKLFLDDDKITIKDGKKERSILWHNIAKINLVRDFNGKVVNIKVFVSKSKSLSLFDFDDMDKILSIIKEKIPNSSRVRTKQHKLNYDYPLTFPLVVFTMGVIFYFAFYIIVLIYRSL
jgi:hypothetical protein